MGNPRSQQRMLVQNGGVPLPRQPSPACAATQLFPPNATGPPIKLPKASIVRRAPVVLVVAAELGVKGLLQLVHRIVPVRLTNVVRVVRREGVLKRMRVCLQFWRRPRRKGGQCYTVRQITQLSDARQEGKKHFRDKEPKDNYYGE